MSTRDGRCGVRFDDGFLVFDGPLSFIDIYLDRFVFSDGMTDSNESRVPKLQIFHYIFFIGQLFETNFTGDVFFIGNFFKKKII